MLSKDRILTFTGLLAGLILTLPQISSSQNPFVNTTFFKVGIAQQTWTVDDIYLGFDYNQINDNLDNPPPLVVAEDNSFSHTRSPMIFENIGMHLHHETDITGAWDLLWDNFSGIPPIYEGGPEARRFEMFRTHWAGGWWVNDQIGVFVGAQYAYSVIRMKDPSKPDEIILGGNERGFHLTGMYATNKLLVKSRLMYDWIRLSKRAQQGSAFTIDLQAYYGISSSGDFGVFGAYSFKSMNQSGPSGVPTEDWRNAGIQNVGVENFSYTFPDISATVSQISAGVYLRFGGEGN